MILAVTIACDDRQGRVFFRDQSFVPTPEEVSKLFSDTFFDEDDGARDREIRALLLQGVVEGTLHRGIDPTDIVQVYLSPPGGDPLFACTLVTEERLSLMLHEAPVVVENFCLQVIASPNLTSASATTAIEAWATRNYPDIAPADFVLHPWVNDDSSDEPDDHETPPQQKVVGGTHPSGREVHHNCHHKNQKT